MYFHYHLAMWLIKNSSSAGCSLFASCILSHFAMISESSGSACVFVHTHTYILGPHSLMPYNSPSHPYQGQHIQPTLHNRCDLLSKRARKTLLQISRSWYSYFTVVARQLLSESQLQYFIEYSWILPVKWQSRNKIKKPKLSPRIFFRITFWDFFSEISSFHSAVVAFFRGPAKESKLLLVQFPHCLLSGFLDCCWVFENVCWNSN